MYLVFTLGLLFCCFKKLNYLLDIYDLFGIIFPKWKLYFYAIYSDNNEFFFI